MTATSLCGNSIVVRGRGMFSRPQKRDASRPQGPAQMDVRCDRCQTEYELDDASVAESGASVQCTTCGHTFVVGRTSSAGRSAGTPPPVPQPDRPVTPTPSWMLTTEEGKTHRFRDSQTLQKWVVERRVTRADRVCPPAAPGDASATSTSCAPSSTSSRRLIGGPPPLGARVPPGRRHRAPRRRHVLTCRPISTTTTSSAAGPAARS